MEDLLERLRAYADPRVRAYGGRPFGVGDKVWPRLSNAEYTDLMQRAHGAVERAIESGWEEI